MCSTVPVRGNAIGVNWWSRVDASAGSMGFFLALEGIRGAASPLDAPGPALRCAPEDDFRWRRTCGVAMVLRANTKSAKVVMHPCSFSETLQLSGGGRLWYLGVVSFLWDCTSSLFSSKAAKDRPRAPPQPCPASHVHVGPRLVNSVRRVWLRMIVCARAHALLSALVQETSLGE
jgi:hypothetical protein